MDNNETKTTHDLSKSQRNQLHNFLIEQLCSKECNHSLRFTKKWLKKHIEPTHHEAILSGFESQGGYCDCEVLANVFHTIIEEEE